MKKIFCFFLLAIIASGCGESKGQGLEAKIKANEEAAQKLCQVYADTLNLYQESNQRFPLSFKQLGNEGYLSSSNSYDRLILLSLPVQGYSYRYAYIDDNHFILEASPAHRGVTGNHTFRINAAGELEVVP